MHIRLPVLSHVMYDGSAEYIVTFKGNIHGNFSKTL